MKNIFKPMLYSTPMIKGILENRKNQTRRTKGLIIINETPDNWKFARIVDGYAKFIGAVDITTGKHIKCPWLVGDILWVRETFAEQDIESNKFQYKADYTNQMLTKLRKYTKWKPSLFMKKEACRIFLKITDLRVERLNDITVWAAESEGVEMRLIDGDEEFKNYLAEGITEDEPWGDSYFANNAVFSFMSLWKSINGLNSWDLNPWVWVIKFERIEKPLDFII